jgi:hypothetical protein
MLSNLASVSQASPGASPVPGALSGGIGTGSAAALSCETKNGSGGSSVGGAVSCQSALETKVAAAAAAALSQQQKADGIPDSFIDTPSQGTSPISGAGSGSSCCFIVC